MTDSARSKWLVLRDDKQYGPFTKEQLQQYAAEKRLLSTDWVRRMLTDEWLEASAVNWLFPGEGAASDHVLDADPAPPQQGPLSMKGMASRGTCTLSYGDFQIFKKLGAGGMGAVYLALQRSKNRRVALKMLSVELAGKPAFVGRFYREAMLLQTLDHPNIVRCYGMGEEAGLPFLALEYIDGLNVAEAAQKLGKLPVGDVLHIVLRCAEALAYAHVRNIIHRDITPTNLLITRTRIVKLSDLGLAKPIAEEVLDETESGVTIGTPLYMAPEQCLNSKNADCRSDIYSLGVVLYRLLTGETPFKGTTSGELQQAKTKGTFTAARRLNADVPSRLDLLIDKMVARDPRHRYQSCGEVIRDLEQLGLHNARLSFDPEILRTSAALPSTARVEALLVYHEVDNIRIVQQLVGQTSITVNMNVVKDGAEAVSFVQRAGSFSAAPRPQVIILCGDLRGPDTPLLFEELKRHAELRAVPLIVVTTAPEAAQHVLAQAELPQVTLLAHGEKTAELRELLQQISSTSVTQAS